MTERIIEDRRTPETVVPPLPWEFNAEGRNRQPSNDSARFPEVDARGKAPWWPVDRPPARVPGDRNLDREDKPGGWGVHWDDGSMPNYPRRKPPEPKPEPPDTRNDGKITYPDKIQPPLLTDPEVKKSVYINADARSIYLTGGSVGAGMYAGTHYLDRVTGAVPPEARQGLAKFWRDNLSPSERAVPGRVAILNHIDTEILPQAEISANAAGHTFARHQGYRLDLQNRMITEIPAGPLTEVEKNFWNARVDLVSRDTSFTSANIMRNAGTPEEVAARMRLYTTHEASQMAAQADEFWAASRNSMAASQNLEIARESRHGALAAVTQAERGSITTLGESLIRGAGRGLLATTGVVAADYLLDHGLGNNAELSNHAHWGIQGLGMPLVLASRLSAPVKVASSLAMIGGSHILDQTAGPPSGIFSPFGRPSLPEVALSTAGALTPVADGRIRFGLATAGYLTGKVWNYLDAKYEITGPTEPGLQAAALAAADADMKNPSNASLHFASSEMKKFADRNEAAAARLTNNWTFDHPKALAIENQRAEGAMMLGLAQSNLEGGTRIDHNKFEKIGDRILIGKDYDFGGQAANYFRASLANLRGAEKLARENMGRSVTGATITTAYVDQLLSAQADAKAGLDKIYGSHDIDQVFADVKKAVSSQDVDMRAFGEKLKEYSEVTNDKYATYKAKLLRDLAILHVAFGEKESATTGERREHYGKALKYLQMSKTLDSSSEDWQKIYKRAANPQW